MAANQPYSTDEDTVREKTALQALGELSSIDPICILLGGLNNADDDFWSLVCVDGV
ncbi:MAG: hypothetical protein ACK5OC_16420 [Pirellula sp.]